MALSFGQITDSPSAKFSVSGDTLRQWDAGELRLSSCRLYQ